MKLNEDIKNIKNNILKLKNKLDNILKLKNINAGKTFLDSINNINEIKVNQFQELGYDETPKGVINDINYSKEIMDNWDVMQTDLRNKFSNNEQLKYMPLVDTSNATNMVGMFGSCYSLTTIPQLDTSNVTNMSGMFGSCNNLTTIPQLNTSNVTNMNNMFSSCNSLTIIPQLDMIKVTTVSNWGDSIFARCNSLAFINILNLGTQPQITNIYFNDTIWGDDSKVEGSKQSLIDSLLNNSFNRAKAGYTPCTLRLSETTKGFLTEAEKKSITDKGYTLA